MSTLSPKRAWQAVDYATELTSITGAMALVSLLGACGPDVASGHNRSTTNLKVDNYQQCSECKPNSFLANASRLWAQLSVLPAETTEGNDKNVSYHSKSHFPKAADRIVTNSTASNANAQSATLHSITTDNSSPSAGEDISPLGQSEAKPAAGQIGSWTVETQYAGEPEKTDTQSLPSGTKEYRLANLPQKTVTNPESAVTPEQKIGLELVKKLSGSQGAMTASEKQFRVRLEEFYVSRNHQPVWVTPSGFGLRARRVIGELKMADEYGLTPSEIKLPDLKLHGGSGSSAIARLAAAELKLSLAVLEYVRQAKGGRVNPRELSPSLDFGPTLPDTVQVMQGIARATDPEIYLRSFHPKHPQFRALRTKYLALRNTGSKQSEAQRILINMERWRWMPENLGDLHIWLNIPEFEVRVVKRGNTVFSERAVVGKLTNQTPVFSDKLEHIVFHPYWNVPNSIKVEEILPDLRHSTRVLQRHNLQISYNGQSVDPSRINWNNTDVRKFDFVQPPGRRNVLGFVKFMFPNRHSVYMHDTPSRKLFDYDVRMFSHGCMRIQNPQRLAEVLLNEDKGWPRGQVDYIIQQGLNQRIQLSKGIPVHIAYVTAWVTSDGEVKFYEDYYGHDRRMAAALTGRADLIPVANIPVTKVAETTYDEAPRRYVAQSSGNGPGGQWTNREDTHLGFSVYWGD